MSKFYLISVVGTRLIGVITILILSHIMPPFSFGKFALINTNALLLQMVFGSWLVSIASRALVTDGNVIDREMMSAILSVVLVLVAVILSGAAALGVLHPDMGVHVIATAVLAIAFIIYDTTLAAKNALGREAAYATFAVYRNAFALVLSVVFVLLGLGFLGPVAALLVGTAIPLLLLPSARAIWGNAKPSLAALARVRQHLAWGLSGGLTLGIYILVTAPARNIIADHFGASAVGIWILGADLFFGPLVVIGNAYALSQVRLIYLAAAASDLIALDRRARELMEFTLTLAIPYCVGGLLFAEEAFRFVLSDDQARLAAGIATAAAIQGPALLILYSLASIVLARHRFWLVAAQVVSVMLLVAVAAHAGDSFLKAVYFSAGMSVATVLVWLIGSLTVGLVRVRGKEIAKLIVASSIFLGVSFVALQLLQFPGAWIIAALGGLACFAAVAVGLRIDGFIAALPPTLRQRFPSRAGVSSNEC